MWSWEDWNDSAETTFDLSYERNELGLIPLSCRKLISPKGRECKAKVFDAPQTRRVNGIPQRKTICLLCGFEDWRKVGLKRETKGNK